MKRPLQIKLFEVIMLATVVVGWIQSAVGWTKLVAPMAGHDVSPAGMAGLVVGGTSALVVLLVLLGARRRTGAAVVLVFLRFLAGAPEMLRTLLHVRESGLASLAVANFVAQAAGFALVMTEPAHRWFAGRMAPGERVGLPIG